MWIGVGEAVGFLQKSGDGYLCAQFEKDFARADWDGLKKHQWHDILFGDLNQGFPIMAKVFPDLTAAEYEVYFKKFVAP